MKEELTKDGTKRDFSCVCPSTEVPGYFQTPAAPT
jgi:hypothetical protein